MCRKPVKYFTKIITNRGAVGQQQLKRTFARRGKKLESLDKIILNL